MKKEEEILSRITGYSIQELHERLTEPILQPYDCLMAMIEFAEQQANGVNTSHEPALHKHGVTNRTFSVNEVKILLEKQKQACANEFIHAEMTMEQAKRRVLNAQTVSF